MLDDKGFDLWADGYSINSIDNWDSEEIYIVFNELKDAFDEKRISFLQVSHCSGIISLKK